MYLLRALTVSFSVFVLVCAALYTMLRIGWPALERRLRHVSKPFAANALFTLQTGPVAIATIIVLCFTLPSFLRYEPHAAEEEFSVVAAALALMGIAFVAVSLWRAIHSVWSTRRVAGHWEQHSCEVSHCCGLPAVQAHTSGVLAVTGVGKQRLFMSADITAALTSEELERAIAHEMVHVRRRDNLAKLAVVLCRIPGMKSIESAWLEAVEMTADERAVNSKAEALDLASALVKVSRLRTQELPELALGFAAMSAAPLSARVQRLLSWEARNARGRRTAMIASTAIVFGVVLGTALLYHPILLTIHGFTEWLVR